MTKIIDFIIAIIAKFPKFFIAILVLALMLGPHQTHHLMAVGWDDVTTVIFGSPGIPIPIHVNSK